MPRSPYFFPTYVHGCSPRRSDYHTRTTTTVMSTTISYYDRQCTDVGKMGEEGQGGGTRRFKHPPATEFSNLVFTIQNDYIVDTLCPLTMQMRFQ